MNALNNCRYVAKVDGKNLGNTAASILLKLIYHVDDDNHVNKTVFLQNSGIDMDPRTFNKHWQELENWKVVCKVAPKTWMLTPHLTYAQGVSQNELINKWNKVHTDVEPAN